MPSAPRHVQLAHATGPRASNGLALEDQGARCKTARAAGAVIRARFENEALGDRVYECIDPEGHRWRFHQRLR